MPCSVRFECVFQTPVPHSAERSTHRHSRYQENLNRYHNDLRSTWDCTRDCRKHCGKNLCFCIFLLIHGWAALWGRLLFVFDINDLAKFYQRVCEEHDHIRASISAYGYDAMFFHVFFFFSYLVMNSHRATWKASHFSRVNSGLLVLTSTGTANLPIHRKRVYRTVSSYC